MSCLQASVTFVLTEFSVNLEMQLSAEMTTLGVLMLRVDCVFMKNDETRVTHAGATVKAARRGALRETTCLKSTAFK